MVFWQILKKIRKTASHDRDGYWNYQRSIGQFYLENFIGLPFTGKRVLDIGCAEGGVLSVFQEQSNDCHGLELSSERVEFARQRQGNIHFFQGNAENVSCEQPFDLILMFDVIEHVADKVKSLTAIRECLKADGKLLLTFPPFKSAFGGHQQVMGSVLKYIPYLHLLPRPLFRQLIKMDDKEKLAERLEIYDRGVTIARFEQWLKETGFSVIRKEKYRIRPRQSLRYHVPVKTADSRFLEEYLTTGVTYLLGKTPNK
ncbi:class I SAM-dependent methyltransferase [bacterium]|nr:class I SAM-dependent methyltransferase [bacterium]